MEATEVWKPTAYLQSSSKREANQVQTIDTTFSSLEARPKLTSAPSLLNKHF